MKRLGDILAVIGPGSHRVPKIKFHKLLVRINNEQGRGVLVHGYKAIALLILNALVICAGLELAAWAIFKTRGLFSNPTQQLTGEERPRERVSYYRSQDWAQRYWYEFRLSSTERYYPYVGWRRSPFKGETIKIDRNGIRVTPGADCSANSFKLFTFGESAMWGTGSPDWDTIPANLQKRLEKLSPAPVCVMNFAESAYVSTQDLIMLLLQLQVGNIPDAVVFYNIGGDIPAGYQSGRAGVHANLDDIAARFEERSEPPTLVDLLNRSYSYSLTQKLISRLRIPDPQKTDNKQTAHERTAVQIAKLGDRITQDYLGAYKIVSALSQQYGFKYFFFLPPQITLGDKPLTAEEQIMKRELENDAALSQLFKGVYQTIEKESKKYPNIHSMTDVFDDCDSPVWIDAGHVTPIGNQMIAQKMMEIIGRSLS